MALSVATLAGFPASQSALVGGSPTDAATYSYTNGVYTQGGTQYVAGLLDREGVVPSRIFTTNPLPTLVSVTQVSASGQSIQELATTNPATSFAGFLVIMTPAPGSSDDGIYPLGYTAQGQNLNSAQAWAVQGGNYGAMTSTVGYPQPQMRFFVSFSALLVLASTSTG
jgi:hypothetical protein